MEQEKKKRGWRGPLGCLVLLLVPTAMCSGGVAYLSRSSQEEALTFMLVVVVILAMVLGAILAGLGGLIIGGVVAAPSPKPQKPDAGMALNEWLLREASKRGAKD